MYMKLIKLADYLDSHGYEKEADVVDSLIQKYSYKYTGEFGDMLPGGLADEDTPSDFNKKQLDMGQKVEMEHTDDENVALEISMDHLVEIPNYYDRLREMEDEAESKKAATLRKDSIMGPSPQKVREYQQRPQDAKPLHVLLDFLGLVPGVGESADLANAALYLSEGITPTNLLLAGLSVTSMVPGLGDVSKLVKYGSDLAPETTRALAKMILEHKETIKFAFDKLKDQRASAYILRLIPQGKNLIAYSDRMFEAVRKWAYNIINSGVKSEVGEAVQEQTQTTDVDQLASSLL